MGACNFFPDENTSQKIPLSLVYIEFEDGINFTDSNINPIPAKQAFTPSATKPSAKPTNPPAQTTSPRPETTIPSVDAIQTATRNLIGNETIHEKKETKPTTESRQNLNQSRENPETKSITKTKQVIVTSLTTISYINITSQPDNEKHVTVTNTPCCRNLSALCNKATQICAHALLFLMISILAMLMS